MSFAVAHKPSKAHTLALRLDAYRCRLSHRGADQMEWTRGPPWVPFTVWVTTNVELPHTRAGVWGAAGAVLVKHTCSPWPVAAGLPGHTVTEGGGAVAPARTKALVAALVWTRASQVPEVVWKGTRRVAEVGLLNVDPSLSTTTDPGSTVTRKERWRR